MESHIIYKGAKLLNNLTLEMRLKNKALSKQLKILLKSDSVWDVGEDENDIIR